jgi:hypothetical protein
METATHTELVTNAIIVECVKGTHAHENLSPEHQVNAQIAHWNISSITINGVEITEWAASLVQENQWVNIDLLGMTDRFKTKKAATQRVVEFMVELLDNSDTTSDPHAWEDEIEFYNKLIASFTK